MKLKKQISQIDTIEAYEQCNCASCSCASCFCQCGWLQPDEWTSSIGTYEYYIVDRTDSTYAWINNYVSDK